jgi:hypothetical protein
MATLLSRRRRVPLGPLLAVTAVTALACACSTGAARAATAQASRTQNACAVPPAYGWPVRPFHQPHAVRGFFGDPRLPGVYSGHLSRSFHTGVDIVAPDGTPVYASITGTVWRGSAHPQVVWVGSRKKTMLGYWHIVPAVAHGSWAVAGRTVIGHIAAPWGHVHLTEQRGGRLLNPLRPGAMGPHTDRTVPEVHAIQVERRGEKVIRESVRGTVDLVAQVADAPPLEIAAPWHDMPVTPALMRWRLLGLRGAVTPWQVAVDFRRSIPAARRFESTYAPWTRQNHPNHPGRYRMYLTHGFDTTRLADGDYRVEVLSADICGNRGRSIGIVSLANGRAETPFADAAGRIVELMSKPLPDSRRPV